MIALETHEFAWAAGFIDGEGSFCFLPGKRTKSGSIHGGIKFSVAQVDRRVLDRLHKALGGFGNVNGPHGPYTNGPRLGQYQYQVSNFERVQQIVCLTWKYLSPIKREQAKKALMLARMSPAERAVALGGK